MTDETPTRRFVRLLAAQDPDKSYLQLGEMTRAGEIVHGMVIAELADDSIHIIGQRANAEDMMRLIAYAVRALDSVPEAQRGPQSQAAAAAPPAPHAPPNLPYPPTIAGQWQSLADLIFAPNTPAIQVTECRRAFYAGAKAFMRLQMSDLDPDLTVSEADIDRMSGWADELDAFGEAVEEGLA